MVTRDLRFYWIELLLALNNVENEFNHTFDDADEDDEPDDGSVEYFHCKNIDFASNKVDRWDWEEDSKALDYLQVAEESDNPFPTCCCYCRLLFHSLHSTLHL